MQRSQSLVAGMRSRSSDVLLPDPANWNDLAGAVGDGRAEDLFGEKDALGVMPQGTMPEVRVKGLALVEPVQWWIAR